jgi:hypothetical protein
MKKIASLFAASICLLALLPTAAGAEPESGWGWHALKSLKASPEVSVVTVPLDPVAMKVPGVFAGVWPKYEEAIAAVRSAIVEDSHLKAALDAKGVAPDEIIGITYAPDGRIAVLVNEA